MKAAMKPSELRLLLHETYAAHCLLTNVGIQPEEVFVSCPTVLNVEPPGPCATITVERGDKRMVLPIQRLSDPDCNRYLEAWFAFATRMPKMPRADLDAIVSGSQIYGRRLELLVALARKGFELRDTTAGMN